MGEASEAAKVAAVVEKEAAETEEMAAGSRAHGAVDWVATGEGRGKARAVAEAG